MSAAGTVNSVDHALRLIALLAESGQEPATVSDLARRLGLPRPTLYRLLATLGEHQFVVRDGKGYRLTLRLLQLGETVLSAGTLQAVCRPYLAELSAATGETVHFAVLDGDKAGYVAKIEGEHAIRMFSRTGWRGPLHATAVGKVMLAWSGAELLDRLSQTELDRYTPRTLTDWQALAGEVRAVRKRGYAVDDQELLDGLICIAAPALAGGRLIGAVSISGPVSRAENLHAAASEVRVVGERIGAAF